LQCDVDALGEIGEFAVFLSALHGAPRFETVLNDVLGSEDTVS
jgi:hypothetical protein